MKNIMKLFLYAALPLALIALGSCSYPKKHHVQSRLTNRGAKRTLSDKRHFHELDPAYGWNTIRMGGLPVWMGIGTSSDKRH